MNFPGHNYFGPGNKTDNGNPVDGDDAIAKWHDEDYEAAQTDCKVREADLKAIERFGVDYATTSNWHSAVGAAFLGLKYLVETVTGVQYPRGVRSCGDLDSDKYPGLRTVAINRVTGWRLFQVKSEEENK